MGSFLASEILIPSMPAYQIMSSIRLQKYVILFPNGCTKLAELEAAMSLDSLNKKSRRLFTPYLSLALARKPCR